MEIKFRAFIEKINKIGDWEQMKKGCDRLSIFELNGFIMMQYTGIKDKDEKEIYEGDILEICDNRIPTNSDYASYRKTEIGQRFFVKRLRSGFTLLEAKESLINCETPNLHRNINNYTFWNHQRCLKIVGNIYENKELLKKPDNKCMQADLQQKAAASG